MHVMKLFVFVMTSALVGVTLQIMPPVVMPVKSIIMKEHVLINVRHTPIW